MSKRKAKKARRYNAASLAALSARNAVVSAGVAARYGRQEYTPFGLEQMDNKTLSKELSKARSILRKRYERATAANVYTRRQSKRIKDLLTPVKDIPMSDRAAQLSLIARELARGSTTTQGARAALDKAVEDFQSAQFTFVNKTNVKEFIDFAEEFSEKERAKAYGSGVLYKYYTAQKARIDRGDAVKSSRPSVLQWLAKQEK